MTVCIIASIMQVDNFQMAQKQQESKIGFESIQLFKDQIIGIGSYGKVCKAECDGLLCAAKLIHETLFDPTAQHLITPQREHRLPMKRFEQECEILSTIRHPNIVQYLGMYQDPDTNVPVILMELMDDSLTHFLETSPQPIPYHIQVNICRDITLALSFLHSNGIVHRDLSSNNVLMIGNIRAKVADFGMARLGDLNSRATHLTFTMCPGTKVYMPPEAVKDKPVYTEKIDCFSFGVITVQILTRHFPKPGDRRKEIEIEHVGIVEKRISECERRQNDISKIDSNHPLLLIALNCLKDKDFERPSAQELCKRIATLQRNHKYSESLRAAREKSTPKQGTQRDESQRQQHAEQIEGLQQIIQSQMICLKEKDQSITQKDETIEASVHEIQQLRLQQSEESQQLEEMSQQLRGEIQTLEQQRNKSLQVKREKDRIIEKLKSEQTRAEGRISELELQLSQRNQPHPKLRNREESRGSIKLRWREGQKAPCKMNSNYNIAVDGNIAYLRDFNNVYSYTVSTCTWSQLPDCRITDCPSVIVNNLLTLVGGGSAGKLTDKLFSLAWVGRDRRWSEVFPPMPTRRSTSSALCTGTALIVAGGVGESGEVLKTVEIMNTDTRQWSTAVDLPEPTSCGSLVQVDNDHIYSLGGYDKLGPWSHSQLVYTCSVSALLQSCNSRSLGAQHHSRSLSSAVWSKVANLPVKHSSGVSLHGRLLVVGGKDSHDKPTSALHMYNPSTNSWQVISHMAMPRYNFYAAVLPGNQLMVVGGITDSGITDTVEIATASR